jgi:hypothetical protein
MHGCSNYPTKSGTVLYILECLLLSFCKHRNILYRINRKEIKIVYCVVFIVTWWLTCKPGYGRGVPTTVSCIFLLQFTVTEVPLILLEV